MMFSVYQDNVRARGLYEARGYRLLARTAHEKREVVVHGKNL